jgi:hypothetical protein
MKWFAVSLAVLSLAMTGTAAAQSPLLDNLKKLKPGFLPMTMSPVNSSVTDLLNNGWRIAGGAMAGGLTLEKDGHWLICEIDDGRVFGSPPSSHCFALN